MHDLIDLLNRELADRYSIRRELGKGGMATVFLAEDARHDRLVALKVMLPALASAVGTDRFLREIQIAAHLRHPHILPLLDSGEVGGLPFYVMPFVEGESVREKLNREKQLAIPEAIRIGREVADALSYAHERGIVHRDIKPANIMLESGHAVVADFGIALAAQQSDSARLTASGVTPGSPLYMSPEQAAGEGDVDGRSDVYSLGIVLFEMLSGDPPFVGRLPQAILAKKLRESPPGLRVVRDSVPESLEDVVQTALARSPADRFKTVEELGEALRAVEEGRAVGTARVFRDPGRLPAPTFNLRSPSGILAAALAALLTFTVVGFLTNRIHDVKLRIPPDFTPSRWDFPVVGFRAMIPVLFLGLAAYFAFWILPDAGRLLSTGLQHAPRVGKSYSALQLRASSFWQKARAPLSPRTVASGFFLACIALGVASLIPFWDYLEALWSPETEILSHAYHPLHERYTLVLATVIVGLFLAWKGVFRSLGRRGRVEGRVAAARWGSLAWIGFLLIMVTLPWRLVYNNDHERVRLQGERSYILLETETELVVYRAESGATTRHQKNDDLDLQRFGTVGYIFEGSDRFEDYTEGSEREEGGSESPLPERPPHP